LTLPPERGCVEDQPQQLHTPGPWNSLESPVFSNLLRLVEDDTAALRQVRNRRLCQDAPFVYRIENNR